MGTKRNDGTGATAAHTVPRPPASRVDIRAKGAAARIFVADDDDDARSAVKHLLLAEGHEVIDVANGAQALELLASAADAQAPLPDVVLLDFLMPGFSGLGILRVMRRFAHVPPTIIMTGFADPSVETFARNLGALRVLRKPLDLDELLAAVRTALARGALAARQGA